MCTVSFIPVQGKVFITHNRDEKIARSKALYPKEYTINGHKLLFPRDTAAGGSWFAMNMNGSAAVLLNGGFTKHIANPPYRMSRGLVFLDIMAAHDLYLAYSEVDLTGIEPFTMIIWTGRQLFECRWDADKKHIVELSAGAAHTWSSATLYEAAIISKRKKWFEDWLRRHPHPSMEDLLQFHLSAGDGDLHNSLRMNRDGFMLTVSVTGIEITKDKSMMQYLDLASENRFSGELSFTKAAVIQ